MFLGIESEQESSRGKILVYRSVAQGTWRLNDRIIESRFYSFARSLAWMNC